MTVDVLQTLLVTQITMENRRESLTHGVSSALASVSPGGSIRQRSHNALEVRRSCDSASRPSSRRPHHPRYSTFQALPVATLRLITSAKRLRR